MKFKLKAYGIWEYGQRKDSNGNPHQEDSLYPLPDRMTDKDRLFILCDGMGGHDAGEVASSVVCEAMSRSILDRQPDAGGFFSDEILLKAIADAYDALNEKDTGAAKKMGTTMAMLKFHDRGCTIAHIGDSRVYHIRPGKDAASTRILFQTRDHSLVNDLVSIGELTEEEARHSGQKNVITRAMQPNVERRAKADIYHTDDICRGDYFYLCTDGMLENMGSSQICYNFSDTAGCDEEKVRRLILATQENHDNHSAIIVHVEDVSGRVPMAKDNPRTGNKSHGGVMAKVEDAGVAPESDVRQAGQCKPFPSAKSGKKDVSRFVGYVWKSLLVVICAVVLILFVFPSKKSDEGQTKVVPKSVLDDLNVPGSDETGWDVSDEVRPRAVDALVAGGPDQPVGRDAESGKNPKSSQPEPDEKGDGVKSDSVTMPARESKPVVVEDKIEEKDTVLEEEEGIVYSDESSDEDVVISDDI